MSTMRELSRRVPFVAQHAQENGWEVVGINGRGHFQLRHEATGRKATCAHSPSDWRAPLNTVLWMKQIEAGTDRRAR